MQEIKQLKLERSMLFKDEIKTKQLIEVIDLDNRDTTLKEKKL